MLASPSDLHLGNFLLRLPSTVDNLSDQQIYEKFGPPRPEPVVREDGQLLSPGVPGNVYWPMWMAKASDELRLSESKILLADFAHAIWAVMGLRTIFGSFLISEDNVTQEQVDTFGRLPDEWWSKWNARSRWFMEDGCHKNDGCPEKLEGRFKSSI
ncbi:hypothetical protein FVEG_08873 [Fusarium verticillioides 7600]|uniref:Uncharacterized protein n=1 Tax=Gibberella moniliformis (strain M3125 / FGSC 7600) TaxID=334819 RepID=W7MNB4_GIBM7|nr:hypothetical protein FVEG_08873 [Fusarium verticillioides 7600]EWG49304.1 hypothetical protein FVEG_08873 [Fusarium verticillioides 7600]